MINTWCFASFYLFISHLILKGARIRHWWFCCMYLCLPNIINHMYIEQLREMIPPPNQNTVGVCNQTTKLIPYYIKSRPVTRLKINVAPIRVSDIFLSYCQFQVHLF
jgi:hypothetical protein